MFTTVLDSALYLYVEKLCSLIHIFVISYFDEQNCYRNLSGFLAP